jgi:hypothetical protein
VYRKALSGFAKTFGDDHPRTLASALKLAMVVKLQGRSEEAEKVFPIRQ